MRRLSALVLAVAVAWSAAVPAQSPPDRSLPRLGPQPPAAPSPPAVGAPDRRQLPSLGAGPAAERPPPALEQRFRDHCREQAAGCPGGWARHREGFHEHDHRRALEPQQRQHPVPSPR